MKQKIIQKIDQQIEAGIYPGASFAYYQDGVWSDWYLGEANPEIGEKTREGLVYDLASVSKVVGVGTVLTFLWKEGKIELDQSIKVSARGGLSRHHRSSIINACDGFGSFYPQ